MTGEPTLEVPIREIIPDDWRPFGRLQDVNIDGDTDQEILFFYNYDNLPGVTGVLGNGPVGAIIYDIQIDSGYVTGDTDPELYPIPNQPAGFYIPYRILPNYWEPAVGRNNLTSADTFQAIPHFIALPDAEYADISVTTVSRSTADDSGETAEAATAGRATAELIIRGGETHITIVWWKNRYDGYGVTQLHAPYGFMNEEPGAAASGPIDSVVGSFPQNDRSRLCRRVRYMRESSPADDGRAGSPPAIRYNAVDQGLFFCDAIPIHPFYPEGVALAYLRYPTGHGGLLKLSTNENASVAPEIFDELVKLADGERIDKIYTRVGLPHTSHRAVIGEQNLGRVQSGPGEAWQTHVCVEVTGSQARQLRLRLHHEPPRLFPNDATRKGETDRWYITDLIQDPNDGLTCRQFIEIRPPNSN